VDRAGTAAKLDRRQDTPRRYLQTWQRWSPAPACWRRHGGDVPLESPAQRSLALSVAGPQAGDGHGGGIGQQDRSRGLGYHATQRRLAAGRGAIFFPTPPAWRRARRRQDHAAYGGGLRPVLTAVARGAPADPGRDEETALQSNKETEEKKIYLHLTRLNRRTNVCEGKTS